MSAIDQREVAYLRDQILRVNAENEKLRREVNDQHGMYLISIRERETLTAERNSLATMLRNKGGV